MYDCLVIEGTQRDGGRLDKTQYAGFAHLFVEQGRDILFQWQQRVVGIVAPVILHDLAVLFGRFVVFGNDGGTDGVAFGGPVDRPADILPVDQHPSPF